MKVCYFGVVSILLLGRKYATYESKTRCFQIEKKNEISQKHPHLSHELLRIPINKGIEAREGFNKPLPLSKRPEHRCFRRFTGGDEGF